MHKTIIFIFILCSSSICFSQNCNESWVKNNPKSSTNKYLYVVSPGASLKEAIIKGVVDGAYAINEGRVGKSEIRDKLSIQDGMASTDLGANSTLQLNERSIQYSLIDYCQKSGYYQALIMFRKEAQINYGKLPRARRHLPLSFVLSTVLPGSGQLYKKQKGKSVFFR